ncbi:BQ5605_C008g05229 [Microbotryum silenes-dioicae]|uniref:BQ5605_C008g05229 protein n=1 Tax=Microbotryum silenes-dioicae TaxID=796604 RepID=A0A2X0PE54_9BASI|nr:BQ5605_C008g05229 [Microbotryum silenes-dioicae]
MFLQRLFRRKAALVRSASSTSNSRPSSVVSRHDLAIDERDMNNLLDDMMAFNAIGSKERSTTTPKATASAASSTTSTASSSPQI